ncbi:MAG: MarR family transcriptional regulator, partial [Candidatus Methanoperedens sp.]
MKVAQENTVVPLLLGLVRSVRDYCQRQEMEMCRKLVLTPSQLACILTVPVHADEFNVDQVAKVMGLSLSRASRVVDSLVCRGSLYRRTADSDRRIHL